ncbi:hypothetical protein KILIM_011_00500 [Kineosphaera limosa NBRC 100340]|uniref:Capsule synthesis protein CapA domain-containing protein n=1 Tax=Kineosphaera limosa NBRC 100340 TaxID=1184609 RepID=K6WRR9_9MICO|nr:hypothetical protein KILIM_011_00500 [Kineosphaera limosa NBRC 100340]
MHFERQVAALLQDSDEVWAKRLPELRDADFSMVNLETAITERGTAMSKPYTFRAPAKSLDVLKAAGVDAVSMANNHAADYGRVGVQDTLAAKEKNVLPIVGFGANAAEAYAPLTVDVKGVNVAVLAASQVWEETAANWSAGADSPGIAVALDRAKFKEAVAKAAAEHDLVVAQMHWGTEGTSCPNGDQAATVRDLQAAGADIVVGTHAHRPQASGWQGRTFVGYGTGNFIWYNTSANSRPSGVLTVTVDANKARERGQATGEQRMTEQSLVTEYTWTPKYISTGGVPQDPTGSTTDRLESLNRQAIACADLAQSRP